MGAKVSSGPPSESPESEPRDVGPDHVGVAPPKAPAPPPRVGPPPRPAPPPRPPARMPAWAVPPSKRATPGAPSAAGTQRPTVSPRSKMRGPTETVKRSSVPPALIFDDSEHSAPKAGRLPQDLEALVAAAASTAVSPSPPAEVPPAETPSSVPPPEMPVVGVFGDYEVFGRLAFGGMAEIFLAREASSGGVLRYVVIKRILPHVADDAQFVEMFLDEARVATRLSHPNICHIYEFGRQDGSYFIAMEWINGISLGKLLRRARPVGGIPIAIAVKIISHIAEALHYAHRARDERGRPLGIVHRDVSPQNIMVSYEAGVKLLDFGVAKVTSQASKTQAGTVKGKFAYMSPQQCMGQEIDARADIFSLGICLYEALTSQQLYHRPNEYETMKVVVEGEVPSARAVRPDLPEALDAIVKKALAKSPDDRFQTAGAMQTALERYLADSNEVVGATRVSEYLDGLYHTEIRRGPQVDPSIGTGLSRVRARSGETEKETVAGATADGSFDVAIDIAGESQPPPKKKRTALWIGAAVALLALAAGGAWALGLTAGWPMTPTTQVARPDVPRPAPSPVPVAVPSVPAVPPGPSTPDVATPVAPQTGVLSVRSSPRDAHVQIDGHEVIGTTPLEIPDVAVGDHAVRVTRSGYNAWTNRVTVAAGETVSVDASLSARERTPTAPPGTLSINTRPWSKVYVGNTLLGTTPIGRATVPSGTLRLRLVDRDGRTHTHVVQVAPGGSAHVSLDFTTSP